MSDITFTKISPDEIHPVDRYGYDPIPGNGGEYVWVEETRSYVPGKYTFDYDKSTGRLHRTGYVLKGK